ncbi:MAG TPA: Uma2 family endonuclease [Blastocatellia bacterium]|nr:Uma2 family endonuclease [Blastocatellia bacterium]
MSAQPQRYYFSVDDYYRMADAGVFPIDARVELIDGEVVEMFSIGNRHIGSVIRLTTLLSRKVGASALVSVQNPVRLNDFSEPQPDIVLLKPRKDFYSNAHPTPTDVLLIIEVADTSVNFDRRVKLPLYARAGIPETWVMVLPKDQIEVHSQPVNGKYQKVQRLKRGRTLTSPTVAGLSFKVADLLG